LRVAHHAVQVNRVEGKAPGELNAEHDHPRHPEEKDVVARFHRRQGIKSLVVLTVGSRIRRIISGTKIST
jgi:hypothetical protein